MSLFACCTSRDKTKEEPEIDPVKKPHLLAAAAASGSQRLVEKALEAGYAIDQPDEQGSTPLTAAVSWDLTPLLTWCFPLLGSPLWSFACAGMGRISRPCPFLHIKGRQCQRPEFHA
jgi:hypothetical protein